MKLEEIEKRLEEFALENKQEIRKKEFPTHLGIPSYNTCMRRGLVLHKFNAKLREKIYNQEPKKCRFCGLEIEFEKKDNDFCSHSCSAKLSNANRAVNNNCKVCGNKISKKRKFCSHKCFSDYRYNECVEKWLSGNLVGFSGKAKRTKEFVRRYIFETRGTACSKCGWDEKHPVDGLPLTQIDHIDGKASNTVPENLRVLCPNCHSMTETYLNRNKNSCRVR